MRMITCEVCAVLVFVPQGPNTPLNLTRFARRLAARRWRGCYAPCHRAGVCAQSLSARRYAPAIKLLEPRHAGASKLAPANAAQTPAH